MKISKEINEESIREPKIRTINLKAFENSQAKEIGRREAKREADKKIQAMREENDKKVKAIQKETALKVRTIQEESKLKAKEEAQKNIDKGEKNALIETCNLLIGLKYKKKRNSWLKRCTVEELKKVILYTQKETNNDYEELVDSIFSSNATYVTGR